MRKTIFITAFQNMVTKNILNTGVFADLVKRDVSIIIFCPHEKEQFLRDMIKHDNVKVIGISVQKVTLALMSKIYLRLCYLLIDSHYLWYKKVERRDAKPSVKTYIKYYIHHVFTKLFSGYRSLAWLFRASFLAFVDYPTLRVHFKEYKPAVLFSTDIFDDSDTAFLQSAKKEGVPMLGMVRSWDNCYSKGLLRMVPDHIVVNNTTLKKELVDVQFVDQSIIEEVGLPQFDHFLNDTRMSREQFCKETGLDPSKKIIVFAPAGSALSDTDWQICDILKDAITQGKFIMPVQFLVRNHPNHPMVFKNIENNKDFVVELPGKVVGSNPRNREFTLQECRHLADTLFHCDVLLYIATTLGLDATVYNKPQIMINFDGFVNKKYTHSVRRYHDEDHMKKLIATGGVRVAKKAEDLIEYINMYLKDPSVDNEGRKKIVTEQLYKIDGKSAERLGAVLSRYL